MHPSQYTTDASQVGLIGTLLSGTTLAWFTSLLEKGSPLLYNFEEFISEFKASLEIPIVLVQQSIKSEDCVHEIVRPQHILWISVYIE